MHTHTDRDARVTHTHTHTDIRTGCGLAFTATMSASRPPGCIRCWRVVCFSSVSGSDTAYKTGSKHHRKRHMLSISAQRSAGSSER